jgi:hypothetical protein
MLKKTLAFGLIMSSALGVAIAPASAEDLQGSNQVIHSTTVAVDNSHATSYNSQQMYENIYNGFGYTPYDHEAQLGNQIIQSTTVAVDDSTATSVNQQFSEMNNFEEGFWGDYPYSFE